MTYQILYAAFIFFCAGLFLAISSRNLLKIFIGILISYSSVILLLYLSSNPYDTNTCTILSILAPILTFIATFISTKIYKKYNTIEIDKVEKIIKEEKW